MSNSASEFAAALSRELPQQQTADNEVFLSFTNDDEGIAFAEWWQTKGAAAFAAYFAKLECPYCKKGRNYFDEPCGICNGSGFKGGK